MGAEFKRRNSMSSTKQLMKNLLNDESGQDLIEYALVAAIIALGAIAAMKGLATSIGGAFNNVNTTLSGNS
jgi:pilus assembly protein Flp/PilA